MLEQLEKQRKETLIKFICNREEMKKKHKELKMQLCIEDTVKIDSKIMHEYLLNENLICDTSFFSIKLKKDI